MDANMREPTDKLQGYPTPPPVRTTTSPTAPSATKCATVMPLASGFDPSSVRCAVETHLHELLCKDEDLLSRMKAFAREREEARIQTRLGLMTDGYRVDQSITPKLFQLGRMLTQILRLVQPLDLFVWPSHEQNAFCLPSRKGNRLVMCLNSGLIASLGSQELLFVMGHEVGHALLKHGATLHIDFDNPHFSPLEVVRLRALERAQEISCDRFGVLACQDVRAASSALFKIASGLTEKWISFDETAYSQHFDELSSMAEVIDLEDASRTHPLVPLRVKAMILFAKSDLFAKAFGRTGWSIDIRDVERGVETMLSVLSPDLGELENAQEKEAFNQFLIDGALMVIAADGVVDPQEVVWLNRLTESEWSAQELATKLSGADFRQQLEQRLEGCAHILRNKLPEQKRSGLLHAMCEVALSAGGIPQAEFEVLDRLRHHLRIRPEIAEDVLRIAREGQNEGVNEPEAEGKGTAGVDAGVNPLAAILERANLPPAARTETDVICNELQSRGLPLGVAVRTLISWAIAATCKKGAISASQGKKLAISAIRVCREQRHGGGARKSKVSPADKHIREFGLVSLFHKGEKVGRSDSDKAYIVVSVSRSQGTLQIAPLTDLSAAEKVEPHDLRKDPVEGVWPPELAD